MSYDGKYLAEARKELESLRNANEAESDRRRRKIYAESSEIRLIDAKMRSQMTQVIQLTLSKSANISASLDAVRKKNLELQAERTELLVSMGYPSDYLDPIYHCRLCSDTGNRNGTVCSCLQKIYNRKITESLSSLMLSGNECFENFDLSLYPSIYDSSVNASPAECMAIVFRKCKDFAEHFPVAGKSFLMQGGTGLGKTYLSACIARKVAEKGCSVCYDTASSALAAFERQIFSKDPVEASAASAKANRELDCDLMILDDLGTELTTIVSVNALYTLINTRILRGKSTIVSTNCSNELLLEKYGEQIYSRLTGAFERLPFCGNDIRKLKRK